MQTTVTSHYDIAIIGGGINGTAIAVEAATRGLTVILFEEKTLAAGTSSASTSLIHGGLRYLENYEFMMVRHALKEQAIWQQRAPDLVKPLAFALPYEKHMRPKWLLRIGLWIYDHLYLKRKLPATRLLNRKNSTWLHPLKKHFTSAFNYYDCQTDDARLVVAQAELAKQYHAHIKTQRAFKKATHDNEYWNITTQDTKNKQEHTIQATCIINASGPWVNQTNQLITPTDPKINITLVKGSHIIVPQLYTGNHAFILQTKDDRIMFTIPYHYNTTLIGTTDVVIKSMLEPIVVEQAEINYMINIINHYFNQSISQDDIIWQYSGVRPLAHDSHTSAKKISREYQLSLSHFPKAPLLTVAGGKLTAARKLAQDAIDQLHSLFTHLKPSISKIIPLQTTTRHNIITKTKIENIQKRLPFLSSDMLWRWHYQFDHHMDKLVNNIQSQEDLGKHFGKYLYEAEVKFLINDRWATNYEDVAFRFTKIGLALSLAQRQQLEKYIQSL